MPSLLVANIKRRSPSAGLRTPVNGQPDEAATRAEAPRSAAPGWEPALRVGERTGAPPPLRLPGVDDRPGSDDERSPEPPRLRKKSISDETVLGLDARTDGLSPLCLAVREGEAARVDSILWSGTAAVDGRTHAGETPLIMACWFGHEAIARSLLDARASVELATSDGNTALHCAAYQGHAAIVALLLEHGAPLDAADQLTGKTALIKAAYVGHADVVRLLAAGDRGRSGLDTQDSQGYTALAFACSFDHAAAVGALLDARAAPDVRDVFGITPLIHAAARGHADAVQQLLQASYEPFPSPSPSPQSSPFTLARALALALALAPASAIAPAALALSCCRRAPPPMRATARVGARSSTQRPPTARRWRRRCARPSRCRC